MEQYKTFTHDMLTGKIDTRKHRWVPKEIYKYRVMAPGPFFALTQFSNVSEYGFTARVKIQGTKVCKKM